LHKADSVFAAAGKVFVVGAFFAIIIVTIITNACGVIINFRFAVFAYHGYIIADFSKI